MIEFLRGKAMLASRIGVIFGPAFKSRSQCSIENAEAPIRKAIMKTILMLSLVIWTFVSLAIVATSQYLEILRPIWFLKFLFVPAVSGRLRSK